MKITLIALQLIATCSFQFSFQLLKHWVKGNKFNAEFSRLKAKQESYDVIVVGSGIGGLSCAGML